MKNKPIIIIFLLVLLLSTSIFSKKIALLIGLNNYLYLPNLKYAEKDAKDLETVLKIAGFDTFLLTGQTISGEAILEQINFIAKYSSYSDTLLFFFSGHGAGGSTETEKGMLTAYSDPERKNAMVSHSDLKESISKFKGKKIVVVDACNQGYETKSQMVRTQGLKNAVDFLLFSSASNQESHDGFKEGNIQVDNGIAAYYLKKAIEGYADFNTDNSLSAGEMEEYLTENAQFYATKFGQYMEVYNNRSDNDKLIDLGDPVQQAEQKGTLIVESTPSVVSVYLNNTLKGTSPKTIEGLEAGTYTIKVTKYGYVDKIQTVTIQEGKTKTITLTLEKEKGKPILKELYTVDWKGTKKSNFGEYDSGVAYAFEFTNWLETHEISGKWYKPNGSLYHSGSTFEYEKTSDGNLSRHWIGYEFKEKENVLNVMKANPGKWKVEVYLDDEYLDTVYFNFGDTEEKGSVYINTTPSGATIYLNGSYKGISPKEIENLELGTYTLKLTKSGYEDKTQTIRVEGGKRETVYITLQKQTESTYTTGAYVPEQVLVKAGTFHMGNTRNDERGFSTEKPVHKIELTYDFYIGKYELTFDEFDLFCTDTGMSDPSDEGWGRGNRPVINVSWNDAIAYCNWLSEKENLAKAYDSSGNLIDKNGKKITDITKVEGYRLPPEAEWEYAARGGHRSKEDYLYSGSDQIDKVSWYKNNSNLKTHEVGQKKPNELGIYDMSGNVYEWCYDGFEEYIDKTQINPIGPSGFHSERIIRGGSFYYGEGVSRICYRFYHNHFLRSSFGLVKPNIGFRIAKTSNDF